VACVDKGVKRQHEYILQAAAADVQELVFARARNAVRDIRARSSRSGFGALTRADIERGPRKGAILMSMQADPVVRVLEALERERVRYAVVGAVAVNVHGLPRFTEDLDIFVAPERENVEALKRALRSVFDDPSIDEISADDLLGDYPAVQYVPPEGAFYVDILTRLGEAFRFEGLETQRLPFEGLLVTVVTPRQLYLMKKDTVRPRDRMDAEALRRKFGLPDD
jgi:hypothetical protein